MTARVVQCPNGCGPLTKPWTANGIEWQRTCERCGHMTPLRKAPRLGVRSTEGADR